MLKQENLFFAHYLEYVTLVLDDNMDEESENFQLAKVQPQGIA